MLALHAAAWDSDTAVLPIGGIYKLRRRGETHAFDGGLIHLLQEAVATDSFATYPPLHRGGAQDAADRAARPAGLPHDRRAASRQSPVDEVESITEIRKRLVAPGISLGALSPEAHETLSIAMNRIGARSDSGEGGEDPARATSRAPTATTPPRRSSRSPRAGSASPPNT